MKDLGRVIIFISIVSLSAIAFGGVSSTSHDLSGGGYGTDQSCVFCHTPHDGAAAAVTPLWNHTDTATVFTPYSSSTLTATVGQPRDLSKACLSCHDGSVAIDAFGGGAGTTFIPAASEVSDLDTEHPISFVYDSTLATNDGGLVTPDSANFVDAANTVPLFSTYMECASCHNPHDDTNSPFLRKSNAGSALCLTCHNK